MKGFLIVLSVIFCLFLFEGVVRTIEAKVVASPPVKVNVLDGVDIDDDKINDMVKEANKILKQADVSLDLDPNISRGVSDEGNGDDKIQAGEDANLDEKGQKEINEEFGNGIGLKVYFTNQIHDNNGVTGCAPHVTEDANGNLKGKPIIYIKNDPCRSNKQLGRTLAHEACHVFTLGDKGLVDINDSLKFEFSDSNGHVMDINNLMYPRATDGNELTPIQRAEIFVGAARHCNKIKNVVRPNNNAAPIIVTWPLMRGGWVDDMYEVPLQYIDLGAGFFLAEHPLSNLEISILTEGLFPPEIVNLLYSVCINTDGNSLTGIPVGPISGVDRIIEINVQGEHPGGEVTAHLQNTISGAVTFLPFASTQRIKKIIDHNTAPYSEPYVDGIYLQVPMELLGEISGIMEGLVTSYDAGTTMSDEVTFFWEDTSATDPAMELVTTQIEPGDTIEVSGRNYMPNGDVTIYVDDEPIGTTPTDPNGSFSDVFFFEPGSDPFDGGVPADYVVRAKDAEGNSDFSILELKPFDGDINLDTVVDFKDIAAIADNWLAGK